MITRPTEQERQALRNRYSPPTKQVAKTKLFKVYDCGKVVFENEDVRLCWYYIQKNNLLKTKPTLK